MSTAVSLPHDWRPKHHFRDRIPRLVPQLWGTTTFSDCLKALNYLLIRRKLVEGTDIVEFEKAFARFVSCRHATSFSSGRVAFYGLLKCLGIGEGDEVLLQVPTHIVVANAIRYTGAQPVFVDCRLEDYNMDIAAAHDLITPRTKALLLQHTFGIPADLGAAKELCDRHGIVLIEDCVHALGATYQGQAVGSFGKAAFFSTEETKIISSTMGGIAVTNDNELAARLKVFQQSCRSPRRGVVSRYLKKLIVYHLLTHPFLHPYTRPVYMLLRKKPMTHLAPGATSLQEQKGQRPAGYEQRLSNGQAMIALRQLRRLKGNIHHRRSVAEAYRARLSDAELPVPIIAANAQPSFVRYPYWACDRKKIVRALASHVILGQWFNSVLEECSAPEYGSYRMGSCPRAEQAACHLVNLPTHPRVTLRDVDVIMSALENEELQ